MTVFSIEKEYRVLHSPGAVRALLEPYIYPVDHVLSFTGAAKADWEGKRDLMGKFDDLGDSGFKLNIRTIEPVVRINWDLRLGTTAIATLECRANGDASTIKLRTWSPRWISILYFVGFGSAFLVQLGLIGFGLGFSGDDGFRIDLALLGFTLIPPIWYLMALRVGARRLVNLVESCLAGCGLKPATVGPA